MPGLRRIGKSWTQECRLGNFGKFKGWFFPLICQDWGKLRTFEASKKQFWRMEAKNIKALQVLLKCDVWTSKKSWKPPLTFMEEWYLGQIYPTVGKKQRINQIFSNKILGSSSLKWWSLNSCSQLPKITTPTSHQPSRHTLTIRFSTWMDHILRLWLGWVYPPVLLLLSLWLLKETSPCFWRVPERQTKKIVKKIRTLVANKLAKRTLNGDFFPRDKRGMRMGKTDGRWLVKTKPCCRKMTTVFIGKVQV